MKKRNKILICVAAVVIFVIAALWIIGWIAPINGFIPYVITLNRPELRAFRDDLLKGNEWAYVCSPLTASLGLGATPGDCAYGMQALSDEVKEGNTAYYYAYSEEERAKAPSLNSVGLYVLRSESAEKRPYVAMIAGGGFKAICTLWESLPVVASFQEMGYTGFCLTHRTGTIGEDITHEMIAQDIAACIRFITEHAEEFNVETDNYLVGGFSAGGWAATTWANESTGYKRFELPKPAAACLIYGVNSDHLDSYSLPTFSRYCTGDGNQDRFTALESSLTQKEIPTDFKEVDAKHGFGLGNDSEAEGWTQEAEAFWVSVRNENP